MSNAHPESGAFLTGRLTNTAELEGSSPVVARFTVNELRFVWVCLDFALYLALFIRFRLLSTVLGVSADRHVVGNTFEC